MRSLTIITVAVLLNVAGFTLAAAENGKGSAADEQAIRDVYTRYFQARNSRDAKAMASFFAPDGEIVVRNPRKGHAAVEKYLADSFSGDFKNSTATHTLSNIQFVKPDVAVVTGTGIVKNVTGTEGEAHVVDLWTMVKENGTWRIASYCNFRPAQNASASRESGK